MTTLAQNAWAMLALAALATFMWRALGVVLSGRIPSESRLFDWVNAVAYAMVGGLMMRIIIFPTGTLVDTPLMDRVIAFAAAVVVWALTKRSIMPGLASGIATFSLLTLWREGVLPF